MTDTNEFFKLPKLTLPILLEYAYKNFSDLNCVSIVDKETMTYSQFYTKVAKTIEMLKESGIQPGDKVAILSENLPHWGVSYFAITSIGAIAVPILTDFHHNEIVHIVKHSEAKAIFISDKQMDAIVEADISNLICVINIETLSLEDKLCKLERIRTLVDEIKKSAQELKAKMKNETIEEKEHSIQENDLAVIIYTSGTTGHSKGVMLSHKNLVSNAMAAKSVVDIAPDDRFLSILPLAHTFECTVGFLIPILHGSSIFYIEKPPTPSVLMKAFASVKPTYIMSVPLIIEKIYRAKVLAKFNNSFILSRLYKIPFFRKILNKMAGKKLLETFGGELRFFGIGGSKLSPYVEDFLTEAQFPFSIGYGLTETSPLVAGKRPFLNLPGSTGPAVYGVEIKIDEPSEGHGDGEILVRGPNIMMGYYKDEEKTAEVIQDGWFHTGDLGYLDEAGNLIINGRSKNVIIGASGENIYPEQIEAIINLNEFVLDSLVFDMDSKLAARIHLDYELIDQKFNAQEHTESDLHHDIENFLEQMRIDLNKQLSNFSKVSKYIEQTEPFVKTPTKKIKRYLYITK
ncbi:MAG: AMP-binding protein [Campylobacterota bacterium]|nr:AMP-binding protein [Campylobacterota bacterium]